MSGIAMFTIVRSSSVMKNPSDMTISTIHGLPRYLLTMTDLSLLAATRRCRHTAFPPHNSRSPHRAVRSGASSRHAIAAAITRAAAIPCTVRWTRFCAAEPAAQLQAPTLMVGAPTDNAAGQWVATSADGHAPAGRHVSFASGYASPKPCSDRWLVAQYAPAMNLNAAAAIVSG